MMYHEPKRKNVKNIIAESMMTLMKRKLYIDITVSELVDYAQVSRASFYRNYRSIDDVLSFVVNEIYSTLIQKLKPSMFSFRPNKWYETSVSLFKYIFDVKDKFFEVESENASYILYRLRKKYETENFTTDYNYIESYLSSAIIGIVYTIADKWRKQGYIESPETLALITIKIITPILSSWDNELPSLPLCNKDIQKT